MAKSFLVPINLNQLELQNATIQNLASAPASPVKGQIYFNTTTNKAMVYDGTNWVPWEADTNTVTGVKGSSESTYRTGNVNITAANVGAAASSHSHGNITSAGALQTTDISIANGDKLVVTDASDSNKVARTSVSFDGSTATKALTQKGTFETFNNYTHPAYDAATAAAKKIGRDATGHVVIGDSLTASDVGAAASSHSHGNISSDGKLAQTEIDIQQDDHIVITDANDNSKIKKSSAIFDGATTTKALTQKGTFETFVTLSSTQSLSNKTYNGYTLAGACSKSVDTSISAGSTSTNLPNSAAVASFVSSQIGDLGSAMVFRGTLGTGGTVTALPTTGVKVGDTYRVITAGTYAGIVCEVGDLVIATATTPTWTVAQTNIDGAVTASTTTTNGYLAKFTGDKIVANGPQLGSSTTTYLNNAGSWATPQDTKNTAGSTDSSSKLFLIGATSQAANPQTYSHDTAYVGTDGCLYSGGTKVLTAHQTYTAVTGKPTGNQTPGFGSTFTISQISQSTTGQITATDRTVTIPNAIATTSANGLMSYTDKAKLDDIDGIVVVEDYLEAGQTTKTITVADTGEVGIPLSVHAYDNNWNEVIVDVSIQRLVVPITVTVSIASAVSYGINIVVIAHSDY